jgi:NADH-quinone oxidoreductase subunit K
MVTPITYYLAVSCALFAIGAIGVLIRRNAIIIFMCIEMMLNAVNLALVAFSDYYKSIDGQMLVFFVMVVAAAEVAVGLALIYVIFRNKGTVYVDELNIMKW